MGFPLAEEKAIGPACIIIFLGLEIDTLEMVIRIPQEKLVEVRHKLHMVLNKKKVTLKELQSLVGLLNFCARAIPSVCAFNRRFYDAMRGICRPGHFIRVSVEMKEDILMWLSFIERFNGSCSFGKNIWLSNREKNFTPIVRVIQNWVVECTFQVDGRFFSGLQIGVILRLWQTLFF